MEKDPLLANPIWNGRNFLVNRNLCFVIMPFEAGWSNTVYNYIKRILSKFNLDIKRADTVTGHIIMEDIWRLINEAIVVLADVTENNPNVFYELGIAHTLGKNVVLIAQNTDYIPFDISAYRHIIYDGGTSTYEILEDQLPEHIENIMEESPTGNPMIDDIVKKAGYWKTQTYEYEHLLTSGKLRSIRRFSDIDLLSDYVLTYCLMSSIYHGMAEEMTFWIKLNKNNMNAGKVLGLYVMMPYRRPKYRSAYIIQFLDDDPKTEALNTLKKESPKNNSNNNLIYEIENSTVKEYVEQNKGKDPELMSTNVNQLINEFNALENILKLSTF